MAIAFKPTCGLNAFALQYVNSQCQHDSLSLKLAAKLHLFTETSKSPTDYFNPEFSYILCIYFSKPSCGISIMCPPNAFDFSAFIKFSLVGPSEATPYLPSFCPTTQSVSMNAEKFACFFYGITSKIRYFRLFVYHNNLSPFDLYFQTCDHVILFFAPQRYSYRPQPICVVKSFLCL